MTATQAPAPVVRPTEAPAAPAAPKRQLSVFDSTCIIVGIIIGSSIYESTKGIASNLPGTMWLVGFWVIGGALSLVGAMCYAELAGAYPRAGGDYVYLTRAYGRPVGFLFAWAQLWIVRPGSIGTLAYVFARYANELRPLKVSQPLIIYAAASIFVLSAINVLGVRQGKWTQNLLTVAKVLGLVGVTVAGLWPVAPTPAPSAAAMSWDPNTAWDPRYVLIMIFLAYGGWNEMAYVAAEVRNPQRNILRSLIVGTVAVTLIYVLVTLGFVHGLGYSTVATTKPVAAQVLRMRVGEWGARGASLLICISALGSINGMIFTGARITYAMGAEHRLYAALGRWNPRLGTPLWSLIAQAIVTLALVIGFGWKKADEGFDSLVIFTTPVFWIFFFLVGLSLFVLRVREPNTERPYRVALYPLIPMIFCASCLFMIYAGVSWALQNKSAEAWWSIGILGAGVVLCFMDPRPAGSAQNDPGAPNGA